LEVQESSSFHLWSGMVPVVVWSLETSRSPVSVSKCGALPVSQALWFCMWGCNHLSLSLQLLILLPFWNSVSYQEN
jgi:hypothetical protein